MLEKSKKILGALSFLFLMALVSVAQNKQQDLDKEIPRGEIVILSGNNKTPSELREDTSKIEFQVELAKNELNLLEPIILVAKFRNPTQEVLEIYEPNFQKELGIKVVGNNKVSDEKVKFNYYLSIPSRIIKLEPGEVLEKTIILSPGYNLFRNKGNVDVQFYLSNLTDKKIWSNKVNVNVIEPTGIDNEALEFLLLNLGSGYDLFAPKGKDNKMEALPILKTFLSNYENSIYSDYARLELAMLYKVNREADKEKEELLKIKETQNKKLKEIIEKRLSN